MARSAENSECEQGYGTTDSLLVWIQIDIMTSESCLAVSTKAEHVHKLWLSDFTPTNILYRNHTNIRQKTCSQMLS